MLELEPVDPLLCFSKGDVIKTETRDISTIPALSMSAATPMLRSPLVGLMPKGSEVVLVSGRQERTSFDSVPKL